MNPKNEYLKKFKKVYESKNHCNLSDGEALEYFEKLIALVEAVYKPIKKEDYV